MKTSKQYSYYLYFFGGAILLIVVILLFSSLNNTKIISEEDNNIIYLAGHISSAHKIAIEKFNKKQKGKIRVKTVDISFKKFNTDEHKELISRFLRSESDKVDIFLIDQVWVPRFAKWCEPLENYFSYAERNNILSRGLESCSDGKHLVAVPLYVDIALMYYRNDLLKKYSGYNTIKTRLDSSITWEEFIELGMKLKKDGKPFYVFQAKAFEGLMCSFIELMASQGTTLYKNQILQLNTPSARKSLQLLVDLVHKHKLSPPEISIFEETHSYDYFIKNDGIFLRGWPNLDWHFAKDSPEGVKISNLVKTLPPHFKGEKKSFVLGGWNMMVSKFSNHKAESVEFIKYLLSEDTQKILFEVGEYIPANARLYEDIGYTSMNPELIFFKKIIDKGFHRPFLKDYTKISGIITTYANLAITNKLSVEEALLQAENKINADYFLR
ncbi:MAG: extracellular solute-binding protein [Ignavibacteria bacterium]